MQRDEVQEPLVDVELFGPRSRGVQERLWLRLATEMRSEEIVKIYCTKKLEGAIV